MLRLLFDHHAGDELYDRLSASEAFDIERVRDIDSLGPRADDPDIWRYAVENNRVVLTNDKHFTDGTADPNDGTHPGVIRYVEYDWSAVTEAIENIEAVIDTDDIAGYGTELYVPTEWTD
jgi:predicted nuclease of predicted toxin-antitoxin system